jgi:DNA-directed RNA polymerase specialized sigma54-like protein
MLELETILKLIQNLDPIGVWRAQLARVLIIAT